MLQNLSVLSIITDNLSIIFQPFQSIRRSFKTTRETKVNWIKSYLKKEDLFVLDTGASKYEIGGVLSQRNSQGIERLLYFACNRLSKEEQNYCATRKELLAVVRCIEFFIIISSFEQIISVSNAFVIENSNYAVIFFTDIKTTSV